MYSMGVKDAKVGRDIYGYFGVLLERSTRTLKKLPSLMMQSIPAYQICAVLGAAKPRAIQVRAPPSRMKVARVCLQAKQVSLLENTLAVIGC